MCTIHSLITNCCAFYNYCTHQSTNIIKILVLYTTRPPVSPGLVGIIVLSWGLLHHDDEIQIGTIKVVC